MVNLCEVDCYNFNDCCGLERKSSLFVGNAEYCLAEAYIYRENSTAYAICREESVIGLVIILDRPTERDEHYSFTDLFIADDFLGKGYGKEAVHAIIEKFKSEKKRSIVEIQVHKTNMIAKSIYLRVGFEKIKDADWDSNFEVMQLKL